MFLFKSVAKKGSIIFIKDRIYRLFLPFLFGVTLLMLIAYFPSYYIAHNSPDVIDHTIDFFTTERWPVGPPWFIWVLFVFNLLFALSYPVFRKLYEAASKKIVPLQRKPLLFVLLVFIITWLLYVPVAYNIGAGAWTGIGPFDFQLSRVLAYFGYFMLGILVGASDFNNQLFSQHSLLVKRWKFWVILSLVLYTCLTLNGQLHILSKMVDDGIVTGFSAWMIYYSLYAASCTASCVAFITGFRAQVQHQKPWLDSLSKNAYLIYLTHYIFITWTQFFLLNFNIPAFLKFLITFTTSLLLSWGLSIRLRKIRLINKYL